MSQYQRLRWKRLLNDCKHAQQELEFVTAINKEAAPLFQEYYENFLHSHQIDLQQLNQENSERIQEAYGIPEITEIECDASVQSDSAALIAGIESRDQTPQEKLSEDDIALQNAFSKLFKKIALKVHPDKIDPLKHSYLERRQMEKDFREANKALENKEYFTLIDIAERLDISLPTNYNQQIRWMNNQLEATREQIMNQKRTYSFLFSEIDTETEKDILMRQFVQQLFGLKL